MRTDNRRDVVRLVARPEFLFLAALVLWMGVWALTNPPTAAPDEPSHLIKAVAAGRGDLLGRPVPNAAIVSMHAFHGTEFRQVELSYRYFELPAKLRTSQLQPCTEFRPTRTADCLEQPPRLLRSIAASIVGGYPRMSISRRASRRASRTPRTRRMRWPAWQAPGTAPYCCARPAGCC